MMPPMSGQHAITPAALVDDFLRSALRGPFDYPACHHFPGSGVHQRHAVFGFVVHGNEHGTLAAALELQRHLLESPPLGPVTLLLGNVEAAREDLRYLDEDFNRVFSFDRPAGSRERRRAEQVRPILDAADFFLDFHQTQTPTTAPFWTFPYSTELAQWARVLGGAERCLTRKPGQSFSQGQKCLDEYVRDRGKVGLTLEVGFRGVDSVQAERAHRCADNALRAINATTVGETSLAQLAALAPELLFYETRHIVRSQAAGLRLRDGLSNWVQVAKGELLTAANSPEERAPFDGCALFPKYPRGSEVPPPELLRLAQPIDNPELTFGT